MHNTYRWTAETVSFMADAARFGTFPAVLAKAVADAVPERSSICDAGCGTGYLSLALTAHFPSVTAVDRSPEALAVLRRQAGDLSGLKIIEGDILEHPPETPYRSMVFCFFGSMEETISIARQQCRGTVVLIKRSHPARAFSADAPHRNVSSYAEAYLAGRGIPFRARTMTVEMGQPLRSEADALRYVRAYSPDPSAIRLSDVLPRLIRLDRPDFPFYLPRPREICIFSFETAF